MEMCFEGRGEGLTDLKKTVNLTRTSQLVMSSNKQTYCTTALKLHAMKLLTNATRVGRGRG